MPEARSSSEGGKVKQGKVAPLKLPRGGATQPKPSARARPKARSEIPEHVRRFLNTPWPNIADPQKEPTLYMEQCFFALCWFKEMFKRVGSNDKKLAGEARKALRVLWLNGLNELTALALDKKRNADEWAGTLLAIARYWIESDDENLCKTNEAYRQEQSDLQKSKFLRPHIWFPTSKASPLYNAIHRELWCISFYRGELVLPMAQLHVQGLPKAKRPVPEEYQPFMRLTRLSPKSLPKWEPKLWALVTKKYPDLLVKLRANADRKQLGYASSADGKRKWQVESHLPTMKEFRPQFRQHLRAIAKRSGLYFRASK